MVKNRNELPDIEILKEYFMYQNGELRWLKKPHIRSKLIPGDRVGCKSKLGYRKVQFQNMYFMEHRIIWTLLKGPIGNGLDIDHINGARDDNRIENMRLVSHRVNSQNQLCHRTGTKLGAYFQQDDKIFTSKILHNGKSIYLGSFKTREEAQKRYDAACVLIESNRDPVLLSPKKNEPKGYIYDRRANSYGATIKVNGKAKYLGNFKTAKEAHAKYLEAKDKLSRGETL